MNKTKIIISSLLIGLISGYVSVYYFTGFFGGLPFGVAIMICLGLFLKKKTSLGQFFVFVFLSTIACFVAVEIYINLQDQGKEIMGSLSSAFTGSLILILSYRYILKIKSTFVYEILLIILGTFLGLTGLPKVFYLGVFISWQSIMLAAIMYTTMQIEENKKPETPLFLRKD